MPNAFAARFNFVYNERHVAATFAESLDMFYRNVAVINGAAFPLGIGLLVLLIWPVAQAASRYGPAPPADGRRPKSAPPGRPPDQELDQAAAVALRRRLLEAGALHFDHLRR